MENLSQLDLAPKEMDQIQSVVNDLVKAQQLLDRSIREEISPNEFLQAASHLKDRYQHFF
ncbi:MAG: hypothetical protein HWD61_14375 [Parachlamydiaceae bacterium]|nr:MAG: hypothetical protein HWD61_14375 [Parachlamydiaceae bacterium]